MNQFLPYLGNCLIEGSRCELRICLTFPLTSIKLYRIICLCMFSTLPRLSTCLSNVPWQSYLSAFCTVKRLSVCMYYIRWQDFLPLCIMCCSKIIHLFALCTANRLSTFLLNVLWKDYLSVCMCVCSVYCAKTNGPIFKI